MTHKFTQPVSMACTVDQYEKDLKPKLLAMGYEEGDMYRGNGYYNILCTNWSVNHYQLGVGVGSIKTDRNRHFIDHYNPELFLALASMTDAEFGGDGEWWVFIGSSLSFIKGELYSAIRSLDEDFSFIDEDGFENGFNPQNLNFFRKATKQELINHFTKQETMNIQGLSKYELLHLKEQIEKELCKPDPEPIDFDDDVIVISGKYYKWELNGNRLKISRK